MNRIPALPSLILAGLLTAAAAGQAQAYSWTVNPDGSGDVENLAYAVLVASPGDTILVSPGMHRYDLQKDATIVTYAGIYLNAGSPPGLVIRSTAGAAVTTIDCTDPDSIYGYTRGVCLVDCDPETVIEGLTFIGTNGWEGAGAFISGGSPVIRDCVFEGCYGGTAGAMRIQFGSTAVIEDCLFNHAYACCGAGGGIFVSASSPTIRNNRFLNCKTELSAGAIGFDQGAGGIVENNVFEGCLASEGGAILVINSSPAITGNLFLGNQAFGGNGGAIIVGGSSDGAVVTDNVFWGNSASGHGGGIYIDGASPTFASLTVARNTAAGQGGGIYLQGTCAPQFSRALVLENHGAGGVFSAGPAAAPVFSCSNVFGNEGGEFVGLANPAGSGGNQSVDARLCPGDVMGVEACSPFLSLLPGEGCGTAGSRLSPECACTAASVQAGWGRVKALFD